MGVYQRKDGSWYYAKMYRGKRFYRRFGMGSEAKRKAEQAYADLEKKILVASLTGQEDAVLRPMSFNRMTAEYLRYCEANKAPNSFVREKLAFKHLLPHFRKKKLSAITHIDGERFKTKRAHVAAPRTVNTELKVLNTMLNKAVAWGYLKENPVKNVTRLKEPEIAIPVLDQNQIRRLLDECKRSRTRHLYLFVLTALNTGLRKSELFHLEWDDLDFDRRIIHVRNKSHWRTKTGRNRVVAMNDALYRPLRRHKKHPDTSYVFYNPDGSRYHDIRGSFNKAVSDAGLPHITFHQMRDNYATYLARSVDLPSVQKVLGHQDIKTTMKYVHALDDHVLSVVSEVKLGEEEVEEEEE